MHRLRFALIACLMSAGCTTSNVNPPSPRAGTGYVDLYTDANLGLSWEVKRASQTGELRTVFGEFKPINGTVLRLATPPGTQRFELWFNNRVTEGPCAFTAQVLDGKVTPVRVSLTPSGSASVLSKGHEYRPTARATRQVTKVTAQDSEVFRIGAVAEPPREYRPQEQMPYFSGHSQ